MKTKEEKNQKKSGSAIKTILLILLTVIFIAAAFLIGLSIGNRNGSNAAREYPNAIDRITEAVSSIASVSASVNVNEDIINTFLKEYQSYLKPLSEVSIGLSPRNGIEIRAYVSKNDVNEYLGNVIPDLILMFLPDRLQVSATGIIGTRDGGLRITLNTISVESLTIDRETFEGTNIDDTLSGLINNAIEENTKGRLSIDSVSYAEGTEVPALRVKFRYRLI